MGEPPVSARAARVRSEKGLEDSTGHQSIQPYQDGLCITFTSINMYAKTQTGAAPVIMLTGQVSPEDVLHGMTNGAVGYVSKPFRFATLTDTIKTVLRIP